MTNDLTLYKAVSAARSWIRRGADPTAAAWRASSALGLDTADEARVLELAATAESAFETWRAAQDAIESANQKG